MGTLEFNIALVLDRMAAKLPAALYALGAGLLAEKTLPLPAEITPLRIAMGAVALFVAMLVHDAGRSGWRWFSPAYAAAWLDLHNHAGGAVIAGEPAALAAVRARPGASLRHFARSAALPALFVAAAALAPRPAGDGRISGAGIERALAGVERRIEQAEEAEALPEPAAEELRRQLRRIRELAENHPEAAAEAAAALPERVDAAARRRLEHGAKALEKALAAWREMEKGGADSAATPGDMERILDEMFNALDSLAREEGGAENLPADLRDALAEARAKADAARAGPEGAGTDGQTGAGGMTGNNVNGAPNVPGQAGDAGSRAGAGVDRESLERLLSALQETGGSFVEASENYAAMRGQAEQSGQAGQAGSFGQPGTGGQGGASGQPGQAGQPGQGGGDALGQLRGLGEAIDALRLTEAALGGAPGSGGIDRGPGDAPLFFGGESDAAGARFERHALAVDAVQAGMLLERERAAMPEDAPEAFRPVLRSGSAGGDAVFSGERAAPLGPARARAAERYFKGLGETRD